MPMATGHGAAAAARVISRPGSAIPGFDGRNRPGILSDIVVQHGPAETLGRLFPLADTELRKRGVRLSFASFDELVAVNEANRANWRPLLPVFDPRVSRVCEQTAFAVIGCDADGNPVSAHAFRYLPLGGHTLKEELESLRIFYAEPEKTRLPNESVIVTAPTPATRRDPVVFSGAAWFHPAYRGTGLLSCYMPMVRGLAYTRWGADFMFSFMAPELVKGGVAKNARFTSVEWEVTLTNTPVLRDQIIHAALVSTTGALQLQHFEEFVASAECLGETEVARKQYSATG
jgi:hypothetical protein